MRKTFNMSNQITLTEKRYFEWHEDDKSVTLRNKGGSYGGGSEVLIITDCYRLVQPHDNREGNDDIECLPDGPT